MARRIALGLSIAAVVGFAAVGGFVWSGVYNIAADDPHTRPVNALIATLRDRSIDARAAGIAVPALGDEAMIRQGAGNYDAMCAACHLAPGQTPTEMSRGLYPAPPVLAERAAVDPARDFWVIRHGIKGSGMPAWGPSMEDEYVWGMVAFLQRLPALDAAGYRALVASSDGHSHGGGESGGDHHAGSADDHHAGQDDDHHAGPAEDRSAPVADAPRTTTHVHADGTVETHAVPAGEAAPAAATPPASDDGTTMRDRTVDDAHDDTHPHDHDDHGH